jgi:hypothetical protein
LTGKLGECIPRFNSVRVSGTSSEYRIVVIAKERPLTATPVQIPAL